MLQILMALVLTSPAFAPNGAIPKQYTCQGAEISVPLAWQDLPAGTKSLALIVDDPDAPAIPIIRSAQPGVPGTAFITPANPPRKQPVDEQ